jgi:glycosyltransferase involved in cell wall biosynthesis
VKTAVVHDGTIHPGGAVRVVIETACALDADLYVGFSGKDHSWWRDKAPNDVSVLRETSRGGLLNDVLTVRAILKLNLREYDLVITSGPAAKFFQPYDDQLQIHYLHHPPLSSLWFTGSLLAYGMNTVDRIETLTTPHLLANSELTATRAHRQYNRHVDKIIYPPVDTETFEPRDPQTETQLVMVGRLEERKRPQVAVESMRQLPEFTLKLIGDGPLREKLEATAPSNVEFLGYVGDDTLRQIVGESKAGLFLAEREDFGITPIEYMAAGIPVIGVDEPNTNNQVTEKTGILVDPTPDDLADGIRRVARQNWNRERIREESHSYGTKRFRDEITEFVETVRF